MEYLNIKYAPYAHIKAVQEKSLEILDYFRAFCERHKLTFFLCGGCCIGAIREGGFIKWDDDIDIFMFRDDYEALCKLWDNSNGYVLCRSNEKVNYHHTDTAIVDVNTTFINTHSSMLDIPHGVGIDIIPLDGYAPNQLLRAFQMMWAMVYSLFNAQRLPDNQGGLVRLLSRVLLGIVHSDKLRYKLWNYAQKRMTRYPIHESAFITELVSGLHYLKLKYPKDIFKSVVYMKFENELLPVPVGYDRYMAMAFGDYMQLPPKDKRYPKHNTVYYDMDVSYLRYKGIYYLNKEVEKL
jgi:lipopolysaccharide cholinephosphotransferase